MATLEVPQPCTTCQEALPGIPVLQSQECKPRCSNDKYHPKIYYNWGVKQLKPQLHATRVVLTAIMDANTDHSSVCQQRLQRRREQERAIDVPLKHLNNENLVCGNKERPTKDAETPEKRSARLATESIAKRQQCASETDSQRVL